MLASGDRCDVTVTVPPTGLRHRRPARRDRWEPDEVLDLLSSGSRRHRGSIFPAVGTHWQLLRVRGLSWSDASAPYSQLNKV